MPRGMWSSVLFCLAIPGLVSHLTSTVITLESENGKVRKSRRRQWHCNGYVEIKECRNCVDRGTVSALFLGLLPFLFRSHCLQNPRVFLCNFFLKNAFIRHLFFFAGFIHCRSVCFCFWRMRLCLLNENVSKRASKSENLQNRISCQEQYIFWVPNAHLLSTQKGRGFCKRGRPEGQTLAWMPQGAKFNLGAQSPFARILSTLSVGSMAVQKMGKPIALPQRKLQYGCGGSAGQRVQ